MKKIRIISALFCLLVIGQNLWAQDKKNNGNGTTVIVWPNRPLLFLGAGVSSPQTDVKTQAYLKNFKSFDLGAYIPFVVKNRVNYGLNTGFGYSLDNSSDFGKLPNPYQVTGQTGLPVITARGTGSPKQAGFKFEAGPSAMIVLGDGGFGINPSINAAYLDINIKSFNATQTSQVNGTTYNWDLLKQNETKTSGFGVLPKLRLVYMFGRIGVWMEGSYMIGPKVNTVSTLYHPEGNVHQDGTYDLGQMNFPTYTTSEIKTRYKVFSIMGGIAIGLGGRKTQGTGQRQAYIETPQNGPSPLNPNTGLIPQMIHTRVLCENGKKVMKYYNNEGLLANITPIYSNIPCDQNTWPIEGVMGDLHEVTVKTTHNGPSPLNPNTGLIPQMIHTRVFCENGKKVMKYYTSDGLLANITPIYSNIPCDQSTWPITGVMGDLHVNSDTDPLSPIKNWDGTIKNLLEVPEDYMIIPAIDGLVEKMNKSTRYKTSVIADGAQKYLKVVSWDGKESKTEFTPVIDTSPVGIILGYHYSCKGSCPSGCGMKNGFCAPCDFNGVICYEVKEGAYNFHKEFPVIKIDPFVVDNNNGVKNPKYNELLRNLFTIDYKVTNVKTVTEGRINFLALFISNGKKQMILFNKILDGSTTTDWIGLYNPNLRSSIKNGNLSTELLKLAKDKNNYFGHINY